MEMDATAAPEGCSSETGASGVLSSAATTSSDASGEKSVMASNGTQGTVSVSLHPLVIMNISEHWTRTKAQTGSATQVYGAIIGKQKGRDIEIMNSFELDYNMIEEKVIIDMEYYKAKEEQFKQVFTDMDFLGCPLFLQMNPLARQSDLPVNMYESLFDLVGGHGMLFVKLSFTLATEEAERIGLDHVALVQHSAIKMLASRVKVILEYVKAVQSGELPHNHEILREAKALADRLPLSGPLRIHFYELNPQKKLGSIIESVDIITDVVPIVTSSSSPGDNSTILSSINVAYSGIQCHGLKNNASLLTEVTFNLQFQLDKIKWTLITISTTVEGKTGYTTSEIDRAYGARIHDSDPSKQEVGTLVLGLEFPGLLVQPYDVGSLNGTQPRFGYSWDCDPLISAKIWEILFIVLILVLIFLWSVNMMLNLNTPTRYDDPKGKPLSVPLHE
ncbi:COPS6 [Lepeophtheirus salmonis]|uniref:COP9 signalosome complex subunit 6 n=1 Tax=Lepeophtheirus salmonis TaxID=72036 RepID=A0A7R8GYT4_LEPSM|nr:COPS6 [Lepeophtheirus salmonis]CAF2752431.1 COPS6 [Lepeophtheirus salmonis]